MKYLAPKLALLFLAATGTTAPLLAEPSQGGLIDYFNRADIAPWVSGYEPVQFTIEDGVLVGRQLNPGHSATCRADIAVRDVRIAFDFKFAGATQFNVNLNDSNAKDIAHFGHIARIMVRPGRVTIADDRDGSQNLALRQLPEFQKLISTQ